MENEELGKVSEEGVFQGGWLVCHGRFQRDTVCSVLCIKCSKSISVSTTLFHTLSIAFWHLPPNSARTGYTTERTSLFPRICPPTLSASALRQVLVLIRLEATQQRCKHEPGACPLWGNKRSPISIPTIFVFYLCWHKQCGRL